MPHYHVNATLIVPAWYEVEADNEAEASAKAAGLDARMFDYDLMAAQVEFDVEPAVEVAFSGDDAELPF